MTKCTICGLPTEKLVVIDRALREQVPLQAIADQIGISKSSLWRHGQHIERPAAPQAAKPAAEAVPPVKSQVQMTRKQREGVTVPDADTELERQRALERSDFLWREFKEGLAVAKERVVLTKPDGSKIEVPGDLRARAAFLRVGRDTLHLDSELKGLLDQQARSVTVNVLHVIMSPKCPGVYSPEAPGEPVIDLQPNPPIEQE